MPILIDCIKATLDTAILNILIQNQNYSKAQGKVYSSGRWKTKLGLKITSVLNKDAYLIKRVPNMLL